MVGELDKFVPPDVYGQVEVRGSLAPVVARISQYLSPIEIWKFFASSPSETGGVVRFPYCRVDSDLICCRDYLELIGMTKQKGFDREREYYELSSGFALKTILWVEVGFEGLANLAVSPASRNWTSGVGHFVTDEQRAEGIMTNGKNFYESVLQRFVAFRDARGTSDDCFTQHNLEWILSRWRE